MARRVLAAACFLCLTVSVGRGQITNVTNDQATPTPGVGHDYIRMLSETVNPANGSVSLRIQVPTTKGRGLTIPFSFAYDSSGVHHLEAGAPGSAVWWTNPGLLSPGGWSYSVPLLTNLYLSRTYTPGPVSYTCYYYNDYTFLDPSGGRHALGLAYVLDPTGQGCTNQQNKPYSVSAGGDDSVQAWYPSSGSQTGTPLTVADPDGTVYSFYGLSGAGGGLPALIEDRNGNEITVSSSGNGVFSYSDTAGRTVISSSGFGATGNTVTVSGLSAPSYTVYWGGANTNFVRPTVQQVGTDSYCTGIPADTEQQQAITSIHLSNGKYYTLKYETTFGLLNEIDYPTGG